MANINIEPDPASAMEVSQYVRYLQLDNETACSGKGLSWNEEVKTTPLFTWDVKVAASSRTPATCFSSSDEASAAIFEQYAVIGHEIRSAHRPNATISTPIFLNTNAPWSAFICGSQGSGTSYTLSCMLQSCLLSAKQLGHTPKPLTGLVFHYDPHGSAGLCEAAYLASHLPIKVLVSPSNFHRMQKLYTNLPGLEHKIKVVPLLLKDKHLNTQRMLRLMAFNDRDGAVPLYMEVIISVLKEMALGSRGAQGLAYNDFTRRLQAEHTFAKDQKGPMNMRLQLLESFMDNGPLAKWLPKMLRSEDTFVTSGSQLTIVDLTDPFVDSGSACVLIEIALALFMECNKTVGKVIALDEAHKFMTDSNSSTIFTESLLALIREQRHRAVRIIIATQEPTISPKLLDLCSMTFVHRFTSPEWLATLKKHLAIAEDPLTMSGFFSEIVRLNVGEAWLFSPTSMLDVRNGSISKLGFSAVKFRTRKRVTKDGGLSIMAAAGEKTGNSSAEET